MIELEKKTVCFLCSKHIINSCSIAYSVKVLSLKNFTYSWKVSSLRLRKITDPLICRLSYILDDHRQVVLTKILAGYFKKHSCQGVSALFAIVFFKASFLASVILWLP